MAKRPTRSEQESYRFWFFVIAQLIMGSMIWLVFQETFTRRPWKDHQLRWLEVEKARALENLESEKAWLKDGVLKKEVDGAEVEVKVGARIAELEKGIQAMEGAIIDSPKRVEFEKLKKDLANADVKLKDQEILLAFAKADEDAVYYKYRSAKHHGHAEDAEELKAEVDFLHQKVLDRGLDYDKASAERDAISDKIGEIQGALTKAKKELSELQEGVLAAQRRVDASKGRFTGTVDLLLEGQGRIEQFWNQEIDLVDRCHTCHVGFDKCGFTAPKEILDRAVIESLPADAIKKRFCVTREEAERYLAAAQKIRDSWFEEKKLGFEDVKGDLKLEGEPLLATAAALKISTKEAEPLFRTHPHLEQLIWKHPSQQYGCTTCHYGQGRQTKGVGLNYLKGEAAPFDHARRDHYWEAQILETSNHQVEASCFNCHKSDYELPLADHLTKGRKLVQHLGCTGCHPLGPLDPERKHGPALTKVAGKINAAWLVSWIENPRGLRPRTRMPNFWPSALAKDGTLDTKAGRCDEFDYAKGAPPSPAVYGNCAEIREKESAYIAAFLLKTTRSETYPDLPASADAERGKELFESIGCMGCHNLGEWSDASHMPGSEDRDLAPNLTGIGDKIRSPGWIYEWVKDPKAYWHETRMPRLRLSDQEAWDVAAFLSSQKTGVTPEISEKTRALLEEADASDKGRKLVAYYGCFGCHEIDGFESMARVGADLTEFGAKLPSKLDFGDVAEFLGDPHAETWEAWTRRKLLEPRAYRYERASTRMPQFDITKDELEHAVIFLKSQNVYTKAWPKHVMAQQTKEQAAIQRGAFLVDVYNCRGCHMIDDRGIDVDGDHTIDGGDIFRRYATNEGEKFRAPPKLIREGAKVYPDWLFGFLKSPFKLRENYKLRMPTFDFTDAQADQLVAYFAAKAGVPYPFIERRRDALSPEDQATSKKLFADAQCLSCHNLGGSGPIDPKNVAPNLRLAAARLQYDWLFDWLKNPQEQAPGVGMPNFFSPIEDKPGEYETPLTDLAGGDWRRQIELLRALVIELGSSAESGALAEAR